ncbi:MAG TPA: HAD-IIB family hydrolase [Nanoarchaeota archaeon]|nr:HAD-IIB family hydrolase [Nanoarchaeota archaeon]
MQCRLVVFDLDGTLAKSKCQMDEEMSAILQNLLKTKSVGVMSGGSYSQFQKQFLSSLKCNDNNLLKNLFLFPTCSTAFYRFGNGEWIKVYAEALSEQEKRKIFDAFGKVFMGISFSPENVYGEIVEDRGSQVTFSALGQQAPLELKKEWDPDSKKRLQMKALLEKHIPEFEIRIGGTTSIDVTRKGIDKQYGIKQIEKILGFRKEEIIFVGDALFEGGNDYPVRQYGVRCIEVASPEDTKREVLKIISGQF